MSTEGDTLDRLRRTIDEVAAAEIAELVTEARVEARMKVRALLVEAISERLLDLADLHLVGHEERGEPGRGARSLPPDEAPGRPPHEDPSLVIARQDAAAEGATTTPDASEAEPETADGTGCYVYGVVAEGADIPPVPGIDAAHEVFLVRGEGIAAVSSRVPLNEFGEESLRQHLDDLQWLERNARRHEHILDRIREETTLVPMRLCTIYRDQQSVREMLAREQAFLADALSRLDGRTEWGLKIYLVAEPAHGAIPADATAGETPDAPESGAGASYLMDKRLQDRRREQSEEAVEQCSETVHGRLAEASVEAKLNSVQPRELTNRSEPMVFNGVYLVDEGASDDFAATVSNLQAEFDGYGLELELTGPWPPYNFVNSPTEIGR